MVISCRIQLCYARFHLLISFAQLLLTVAVEVEDASQFDAHVEACELHSCANAESISNALLIKVWAAPGFKFSAVYAHYHSEVRKDPADAYEFCTSLLLSCSMVCSFFPVHLSRQPLRATPQAEKPSKS